VVPDPVRRHRHRRAVVPSHVLITGDECRRTSRGRHSAPRAPQESGATIPGTQRRPGQTHTRARGTIEARPPTRHTPPATKNYQKAAQFSSFRVPRSGMRDSHRIAKDGPYDPDIHSVRQSRAMLRPRTLVGATFVFNHRPLETPESGKERKGPATFWHPGNVAGPNVPLGKRGWPQRPGGVREPRLSRRGRCMARVARGPESRHRGDGQGRAFLRLAPSPAWVGPRPGRRTQCERTLDRNPLARSGSGTAREGRAPGFRAGPQFTPEGRMP